MRRDINYNTHFKLNYVKLDLEESLLLNLSRLRSQTCKVKECLIYKKV